MQIPENGKIEAKGLTAKEESGMIALPRREGKGQKGKRKKGQRKKTKAMKKKNDKDKDKEKRQKERVVG